MFDMLKLYKRLSVVFITLFVLFLLGPRLEIHKLDNKLPDIKAGITELDDWVIQKEAQFDIKEDNESRILWSNDSLKQKTEYVLLYLHGFSASWYEGNPVNIDFAKRYKMNAYFPRLADHGINTDKALINMTPQNLYNSAKEALVVASKLGENVIIMSTSTGGTLSLKLASEFPDMIHSLVMLSPNVEMTNKATKLLTLPWGKQLGQLIVGGKNRHIESDNAKQEQYGYYTYRVEGIIYLRSLVDMTMKPVTFGKVTCPVFVGYYYKSKEEQDDVVCVDALLKMYDHLSTPYSKKRKVAFPDAGDHVIGGMLNSKDVDGVRTEVFKFADEILGL